MRVGRPASSARMRLWAVWSFCCSRRSRWSTRSASRAGGSMVDGLPARMARVERCRLAGTWPFFSIRSAPCSGLLRRRIRAAICPVACRFCWPREPDGVAQTSSWTVARRSFQEELRNHRATIAEVESPLCRRQRRSAATTGRRSVTDSIAARRRHVSPTPTTAPGKRSRSSSTRRRSCRSGSSGVVGRLLSALAGNAKLAGDASRPLPCARRRAAGLPSGGRRRA